MAIVRSTSHTDDPTAIQCHIILVAYFLLTFTRYSSERKTPNRLVNRPHWQSFGQNSLHISIGVVLVFPYQHGSRLIYRTYHRRHGHAYMCDIVPSYY